MIAFLNTSLGKGLMVTTAALVLLFGAYQWVHSRGVADGKAEVQATIDAPRTGWAARLNACVGSLTKQNDTVAANSDADTKRLQGAISTVAAKLPQAAKATGLIAIIGQPVAPALKLPPLAPGQCEAPLIPIDQQKAILAYDARGMQ